MSVFAFIKNFFKATTLMILWVVAGFFLAFVGFMFAASAFANTSGSIIISFFGLVGLVVGIIGVGMMFYGYRKYSHSIHVRKEKYEEA